nr:sugar transferase [uncultured Fusobacterium sp.]
MYEKFFKRFLDITCSLGFILCFWWLYILIAILVKIKLGSPIIFEQKRPGLNGKIFTMYKFRSMTDAKDKNGNLLSDAERLPKFGQLLRATSLDEIPEFINVIKGDMSLIGPRPLACQYLPYYTKEENKRHNVRPGITGWAQVNGRNAISWEAKFRYDVEYVEKLTFILDIKIIFLTIKKVIKKEDISNFKNEYVEINFDEYRRKQNEFKR